MLPVFKTYLNYFENLTAETVEDLRDFATQDFHFIDPFNEVRRVEEVIEIFKDMFVRLKDPKFIVSDYAVSDNRLYVRWEFNFSMWIIEFGRAQTVKGVSIVSATPEGEIFEHLDYWDASTQIYMKIPLLGLPLRALRKIMA